MTVYDITGKPWKLRPGVGRFIQLIPSDGRDPFYMSVALAEWIFFPPGSELCDHQKKFLRETILTPGSRGHRLLFNPLSYLCIYGDRTARKSPRGFYRALRALRLTHKRPPWRAAGWIRNSLRQP